MNLIASKVMKIVQANMRSYLLIENLTDSSVYLSDKEFPEAQDYTRFGILLQHNGVLEINPCVYQGSFYAYTTVASDIRVLEL